MRKGCFRFRTIVLFLLVAILVALSPQIWETGRKMVYPKQYTEIVRANAARFELDEDLVYAVIWTESKFREGAKSSAGAVGLMQLTQETYDWVQTHEGVSPPSYGDIETPENNIYIGCALLRYLLNHYGSLEVALSAYNAGMGNVSGWLANESYSSDGQTLHTIPYPETEKYVDKVQQTYRIYKELYET